MHHHWLAINFACARVSMWWATVFQIFMPLEEMITDLSCQTIICNRLAILMMRLPAA
jgi:hypothetical protein